MYCAEIHFLYLSAWFLTQAAVSMLKQDFKEGEMTLTSALALAVKVLNKTMDVSKLSAEKGEVKHSFLKSAWLVCFILIRSI